MNIAIITGASSGLGVEFFKEIQNEQLDEVWVIARREKNLIEICESYGKTGYKILPMDITVEENLTTLESLLMSEKPTIKFLINNAGFGVFGKVFDIDKKKQSSMIDLNVKALTEITSIALKHMDKGSKIINTCSIASFAPNANLTAYSATKAYVMSFSRALRQELKKKNINVTAVCPGPMATEFLSVAGIENGNSKMFDSLPYCNPQKTARRGIKASKKGKAVYTPRLIYKFYRFLAKIVPHSILIKFVKA